MKKKDLNDVVERLEALDSLAQLFKNLWFPKIKDEIKDEKVKAYLMVFEDAFPGLDHVISFVSKNARNLSESQVYQIKEEFEIMSQSLLNREIAMDLELEDDIDPVIFNKESFEDETDAGSVSEDELENLTGADQGTVDDLFTESEEDTSDSEDLDELLSDDGEEDEVDLDDFLDAGDVGGEEVGEEVEAQGISEDEMATLIDDAENPVKKKAVPKKK